MDPMKEVIIHERSNARILISNIVLALLLLAVIVNQQIKINAKDEVIIELSRDRVMYGILSDDGRYFQSVKDIPTRIIQNFTRSFLLDWANFTPDTVVENRNAAVKKLSIDYAKEIKRANDITIIGFETRKFAQQFVPKTYKEIIDPENPRTVKIEITGIRKQWQNGRPMGTGEGRLVEYKLEINKAPPTESNPEGLEITNVLEPAIKFETDSLGR